MIAHAVIAEYVGFLLIHGQWHIDQLLLEQLIQPFAQVGLLDRIPAQVAELIRSATCLLFF